MNESEALASESDADVQLGSYLYRTHSDSAGAVFTWVPTGFSASLADERTFVALDTNILLAPYGVRSGSFDDIVAVLEKLVLADRLIVPGHVAREFAGNRPAKFGDLVQRFNEISGKLGSAIPQIGRYPLLADSDAYKALVSAHSAVSEAMANFKKAITGVREELIRLSVDDPIQEAYRTLFTGGVVVDPRFDEDALSSEASLRARASVPPGYKDAGKLDRGVGDLVIWKTLLWKAQGLGRDLVFVTEDRKADWWHQTGGEPLLPRCRASDLVAGPLCRS